MKFSRYSARIFAVLTTLAAVALLPGIASAGDSAYRTLYSFQGGSDGYEPYGVPAVDKNGNLYGFTSMGGTSNYGTIFKLAAPKTRGGKWTKTILYEFPGNEGGGYPQSMILGTDGNLYGIDYAQTIFELTAPASHDGAWKYLELYRLNGNTDGGSVPGNLVFDSAGNLYGAAELGGDPSCLNGETCGTVFELRRPGKKGGKWHISVLHTFTGEPDGAQPFAGVTFDQKGNLYGTTWRGGAYGWGAVYRASPPANKGQGWSETVLYSFDSSNDDIASPEGPVALDSSGDLYGTTPIGGDLSCQAGTGCGVVFELAPPAKKDGTWTYSTLYAFQGGNDGIFPSGYMVFDSQESLYSATEQGGGGNNYSGVAFRLSPPGNSNTWTETVLHHFIAGSGGGPDDGLTWGKWGDLYGVTITGGGSGCYAGQGCGAVFELRP